jgi:CRP-like cAMP-binding protein
MMRDNSLPEGDAGKKAIEQLRQAEQKRASVRFERGLEELKRGKMTILGNSEFSGKIAAHIYAQFSKQNDSDVLIYLDILLLNMGSKEHAATISSVLDELCILCQKGYNIKLMQSCCSKIVERLTDADTMLPVSETMGTFLAHSCSTFVRSNKLSDFENLVTALWKVRDRRLQTKEGASLPIKTVFSQIAQKDVVEKILQTYKKGDDAQKILAQKTLSFLGGDAILYLLNRLVFSKEKDERFVLMELIAGFGDEMEEILRVFMEEDLPWYAVRNLIMLIGKTGKSEYYQIVEGYLVHPDVRVQKQVVSCIVKLGGREVEKRLVQALPVVEDEVNLKLIMQLSTYCSEDTADGLIDILHKRDTYAEEIRGEILYMTCISLRSYPFTKVVNILKHLRKDDCLTGDAKVKLRIAIDETISKLEPRIRHFLKEEKADAEALSFNFEPENEELEAGATDEFLAEIEGMLSTGKIEKATALLYKKIIDLARSRKFEAAEMLRDKLLEINPDALQDVIRVAEIIEEEKNSPRTSVQIEIWDELFEKLSSAEYEYILSSLRTEQYTKEEKIVSVGQIDPCLYFLNSGAIRLSCNSGAREFFLKRMMPGDVIGIGPFFSASIWTVNMVALQETKVQVLRRDLFIQSLTKFPDLENKLQTFCEGKDLVPELVKISGRDRRDFARYPVTVTVKNILLDLYGDRSGQRSFQGELIDISRGGLSFSIRISNKENAQLLLGRQLVSEINLKGKNVLRCFGLIVAVNYLQSIVKEFTVHMKFYTELEQHQVTDVLNMVI